MAASVAFLHQVEYEAALNEYEAEAQRQHEGQDEDEQLAGRVNSNGTPRRRNAEDHTALTPVQSRQLELRRSLLRGPSSKSHGGRSSTAVANWLSDQGSFRSASAAAPGGPSGQGGGARRPAVPPAPRSARAPLPRQSSTGSQSFRRCTSSGLIERPSLWYRATHVDVRGVVDSLLPIYSPETVPRRLWDLTVMALVIWTAVTVPLSVSYGLPHSAEWSAWGYAITMLFALDLLVNFRTAYYNHQGELIRDSSAVAANYLKLWFWIDLFGTIPFDSIVLWTGVLRISSASQSDSTTLAALGFLKAPRMLRLGRLLRFLDRFRNAKMFRIIQLFLAMILISHWLACVWYMMYRFGGSKEAEDWAFEIAGNGSQQGNELSYYVVTYYYSFLLLVGDNITAYNNFERTFFVIVLIAGTFFYSAVVGQMATLVATMNVAVNRHGQKLLMVQDALRYAGVPEKFSEKVQEYFEYLQQRSHPGSEGMQFLQELPASVHLTLCKFLHRRSLNKVPLFKDCEEGFLSALSLRMRMISLSPREVIFRVGDAGKEMYIIRKGCVAVTSPSSQMWGVLVPGEIFGEVALLSTGKRTANCTALGFVDLAVLTGPDLQVVMRDYPVSAAMIHERAAERARALQVKSKMWLHVSDDEDGFDDLEDLEEEAGEGDGGGSRGSGSGGGSGEADAAADAASASSTSTSSGRGSGSRSGSGSGSGSGDGAVAVTVSSTSAHPGDSATAPSPTSPVAGAGPGPAHAGPVATGAEHQGKPFYPRPRSAITGKPLPMAWTDHGAPPRRCRAGAGAAAAAPAAEARTTTDSGVTALEPPRASIELVTRTPTPAGGDGVADPDAIKHLRKGEQQPSAPAPAYRPASAHAHAAAAAAHDTASVIGAGALLAARGPMVAASPRPCSAGPRSSSGAAPGADPGGYLASSRRESLNPHQSPHVSQSGAAAVPVSCVSPVGAAARAYRAGPASSRRQRGDDSSPHGSGTLPSAGGGGGGGAEAQRPRMGRLASELQRSHRRRSMAFWMQEEAEIAGLEPPAAAAAAAVSGGGGADGAGGAEDLLRQDADEIPWLAPPQLAQRRQSSVRSHGAQTVSSGAPTSSGMQGGEPARARRGAVDPVESPPKKAHHSQHHHHRQHQQPQQHHQEGTEHHRHHHQQQQCHQSRRSAPHGPNEDGGSDMRHDGNAEAHAYHGAASAGGGGSGCTSGGGEISVGGGVGGGGGGGGAAEGGGQGFNGDCGSRDADPARELLERLVSSSSVSRARSGAGSSGVIVLQESGWTAHRRDGGKAAAGGVPVGWWASDAGRCAATADAAAAATGAIATDSRLEGAAASTGGGSGGGRAGAAAGPGPVAEGVERAIAPRAPSPAVLESPAATPLRLRRSSTNLTAVTSGSVDDPAGGPGAAQRTPPRRRLSFLRRHSGTVAPVSPVSASPSEHDGAAAAAPATAAPAAATNTYEAAILRLARRPSGAALQSVQSLGSASTAVATAAADADGDAPMPSPFSTLTTRRSARLSTGSAAEPPPQPEGGGALPTPPRAASSHRATGSSYGGGTVGGESSARGGRCSEASGGGSGGLFGAGEDMEWISTRVMPSRRRPSMYRRGSMDSIHEEDLAALAPASALGHSTSGALGGPPSAGRSSVRWRRGSAEGAQRSSQPTLADERLPGVAGGSARLRRGSAEGALSSSQRDDRVGNGSRRRSMVLPPRLSLQGIQRSASINVGSPVPVWARRSASGQVRAATASPPPPPPPPPDGVFVPRATWNQLMQAVSKLSFFEETVSKLLELVSEQEDALSRLETRAERAATMGGAGGGEVSTSVLGIVAPSALTAAGGGAAAGVRSLSRDQRGSGLGPLAGLGLPQIPGQPRGRRGSQTLHGSGAVAAMAAAAAAAVAAAPSSASVAAPSGLGGNGSEDPSAVGQTGSQASASARVRGAVRVLGLASRLRPTQAGPRGRAAAARTADGGAAASAGADGGAGGGSGNDGSTEVGQPSRGSSGYGDGQERGSPAPARSSSLTRAERSSSLTKRRGSQLGPGVSAALRSALKGSGSSREASATGMAAVRGSAVS